MEGSKGIVQRRLRLESLEGRLCLAASVGWDGPGLGSATLNYYLAPLPPAMRLSQGEAEAAMAAAFGAWSSVADITFAPTVSPNRSESIDIQFRAIDGQGGTLAQAYYPGDVNGEPLAGNVEFDAAEDWEIGNSLGSDAYDLVLVAVHEIGHSLGLDHSDAYDSIMGPLIAANQSFTRLGQSDIDAILALYAPAAGPGPSLRSLDLDDDVIAENESVTLSGLYSASNPGSRHLVTVDWGDGVVEPVANVNQAAGSFEITHRYLDDPGGFQSNAYTIIVRVEDADSGKSDTATIAVTVENRSPSLADLAVTPIEEGSTATLSGRIDDPGRQDTLSLYVNWGDGSEVETFSFRAGTTEFSQTHLYADDPSGTADDYPVTITIIDDDLGSGTGVAVAKVTNSGPEVSISDPPASGWIGKPVDLEASVTDAGTKDVPAIGWTVTREGDSYASGSGASFSFVPTLAGTYRVTVTANDGDGGAAIATAAIAVGSQLGAVDFLTVGPWNLAGGSVLLALSTTRAGFLTLEAPGTADSESVWLALYDKNPQEQPGIAPLAEFNSAGGRVRIDHLAPAGQAYFVQLSGTAGAAALRITNLVALEGTLLTVHGTGGDDAFQFNAEAGRQIVINQVAYEFSESEATAVEFLGGNGRDTVVLIDSPGDDSLEAWPSAALLSSQSDDGVADFTVYAGEFEEMQAYARSGGNDAATLHDSKNADKFKAEPAEDYAKMYGASLYNRVKFFDAVEAVSTSGDDLARLFDSSGDDRFEGRKEASRLSGAGFDVWARGFGRVIAYASAGADRAELADSALADEFHFKPRKAELFDEATGGGVYAITARDFDSVLAEAARAEGAEENGGLDIAKVWPTAADDFIEASGDWMRLSRKGDVPELLCEVIAFETVRLRETADPSDSAEISEPLLFNLALAAGWE